MMQQAQPRHAYDVVVSVRADVAYQSSLRWSDVQRVATAQQRGEQLVLTAPLLQGEEAGDAALPPVVMGTAETMQRLMRRLDAAATLSSSQPMASALWEHALHPTPVRRCTRQSLSREARRWRCGAAAGGGSKRRVGFTLTLMCAQQATHALSVVVVWGVTGGWHGRGCIDTQRGGGQPLRGGSGGGGGTAGVAGHGVGRRDAVAGRAEVLDRRQAPQS
jgi:hypothetical protein